MSEPVITDNTSNTVGEQNNNLFYTLIEKALSAPYIKIDRDSFLKKLFSDLDADTVSKILVQGPEAIVSREELKKRANILINSHTKKATGISLIAAIPTDYAGRNISFAGETKLLFDSSIRLAQELAYLYGVRNLWDETDYQKIEAKNRIVLYLGVMFGCSTASPAVRLVSVGFANRTKKRLPQKALTKTFYYPIIKRTAKSLNVKMTKEKFANGVSVMYRILGIAGSTFLTYESFSSMGQKLVNDLDVACFAYTEENVNADYIIIEKICTTEGEADNCPTTDED